MLRRDRPTEMLHVACGTCRVCLRDPIWKSKDGPVHIFHVLAYGGKCGGQRILYSLRISDTFSILGVLLHAGSAMSS